MFWSALRVIQRVMSRGFSDWKGWEKLLSLAAGTGGTGRTVEFTCSDAGYSSAEEDMLKQRTCTRCFR